MSAYQSLCEHFEEHGILGEITGILGWDQAAMMPDGGAEIRADQRALMQRLKHEKMVDPRVGQWLEEAREEDLGDWEAANLREMAWAYKHAICLPSELVSELSQAGSKSLMVWRKARGDDDFQALEPHLQRVLDLVREKAQIKAEAFGVDPYDALLDRYEPGGSSAVIDEVFEDLADFLPGFIEEVLAKQGREEAPTRPKGPFPPQEQMALGERLMKALGFDFERGRLDTSHHPFCGGSPDDVRMTTFNDLDNFLKGVMAVLHETGHALYSQGLPRKWRRQPVGAARGMAMHESQSLLVEMQVSRSRAFLEWAAPLYREAFSAEGDPALEVDNLYRLGTRVERSFIRVDADEVTYPAHVIMRYRLEKAMIAGDMEIADLPAAWEEQMNELVGIVPDSDRDGCMQDIHWMDGTFGYFPTYTLGAMMAAQWYRTLKEEVDGVEEAVGEGDFGPIVEWLGDKVHRQGSRYSTDELLEAQTGSTLDADYFKAHLRERYLA